MENSLSEKQALLHERADLQARLKLMPYEGEDSKIIRAFLKEKCWKKI